MRFYKPACKSIKQQIPRSIKTSRTSKNSNDNFPSFGFEKMIQKIRCSPLRDNLSGPFVFFNLKLSSRLAESKKRKKDAKLNAHKRKRSSNNLINLLYVQNLDSYRNLFREIDEERQKRERYFRFNSTLDFSNFIS